MANTISNLSRITGLASGLDTETWVKDMMAAQRVPLDRLQQQRQILQWKQEAYRSVNTTLLSLRNTVFNMRMEGTYLSKKVTSTDENVVTATAITSSANMSYTILVDRLATTATNASSTAIVGTTFDPDAPLLAQADVFTDSSWPADGDLSFTINGKSFTVDPETDSLNAVIARVNADKDVGVRMFYDANTRKVSLTTTATGNNNADGAEIAVTGSFMTDMLKINEANEQGGENAVFTLNGLTTERTSNTFTVNGVTFTLKSASSKAQTLTVATNTEAAFNAIKDFVTKYNEAIASLGSKVRESRAQDTSKNYYLPLTDAQKEEMSEDEIKDWNAKAKTGMLYHDTIVSGVLNEMRSALSSIVAGLTGTMPVTVGGITKDVTINNASVIGITTGKWDEYGKLELDEDQLRKALEANPEAVTKLFTTNSENNDEDGLAVRLYDAVNKAMGKVTAEAGASDDQVDNSNIGERLKEMNKRAAALEDRLERIEARYWRQFNAMEVFINQMNTQSAWLANAFSSDSSQ